MWEWFFETVETIYHPKLSENEGEVVDETRERADAVGGSEECLQSVKYKEDEFLKTKILDKEREMKEKQKELEKFNDEYIRFLYDIPRQDLKNIIEKQFIDLNIYGVQHSFLGTLCMKAKTKEDLEFIKFILKRYTNYHLNIQAPTQHKSSPLRMAIGNSSKYKLDIVKCLVEAGVDINSRFGFRECPIHDAIYSGNTEIVEYLLKNGAKVSKENLIEERFFKEKEVFMKTVKK